MLESSAVQAWQNFEAVWDRDCPFRGYVFIRISVLIRGQERGERCLRKYSRRINWGTWRFAGMMASRRLEPFQRSGKVHSPTASAEDCGTRAPEDGDCRQQ